METTILKEQSNISSMHSGNDLYNQVTIMIFFILSTLSLSAQNKILYHAYSPTSSDYMITKWNISRDSFSQYQFYVEETVNNKGQVIQLRFLENGIPCKDNLCYLADIVRFEYPNPSQIIETEYECDGINPMNALFCEVNYKTIYAIDNKCNILNAEIEYFIDKEAAIKAGIYSGINDEGIKIELDSFEEEKKNINLEENYASIRYYSKSFAKYNGKYPIHKKHEEYWINKAEKEDWYDRVETDEVIKCIKNNRN